MIAPSILDRLAARLAVDLAPPRERLRPWVVAGEIVGHLDDRRATRISEYDSVFVVTDDEVRLHERLADAGMRTQALDEVARDLSRRGELTRWRDERYVVTGPSGAPTLLLERSAARFFGIRTVAAHVNGTTARTGERSMWIARRSATKGIDPGQLDNLVGGGVAAGMTVPDTVVKEAGEEAGIPASLARGARPCGHLDIRRMQADGLHRDTIHVHDLDLPPAFAPLNRDGEVAGFRLVTATEVAVVAGNRDGADVMTADASLVVADWLVRTGELRLDCEAGRTIDRLRRVQGP
jgi:8-oxo-dGTP pyrophosphatase MutT (NUDIX family)